jgi:DNA-binding winged helix-turn-helix (wHTH) protein/TolB-like protein/Flp pilus assembly protein TadD
MAKLINHFYEFGPFRVDPVKRLLLRHGVVVPLTPKTFDTLLTLVESNGQVIGKDELMSRVWPDTIVEESGLARNISVLRKALGESPDEHQYIVTAPGRGYQFVAGVQEVRDEGADLIVQERSRSYLVGEQEEETSDTGGYAADAEPAIEDGAATTSLRGQGAAKRKPGAIALAVCLLAIGLTVVMSYVWIANRPKESGSDGAVRSLAVLPFKPLSSDGGDKDLGLGMADTLITRLSSISQIIVRPTSAIYNYAALDQDALAAGRKLGVDFVLEGSIQRSGETVRVTLRLLNVQEGSAVWSYKGDERAINILAMQDSISEQVARALIPKLTGEQRSLLAKHSTHNTEAHQLYLNGRTLFLTSAADVAKKYKAIEFFNRAIEKDPDFALAYSAAADTYMVLATDIPPTEAMPKAKEAALKALALDDTLAEPHVSLGNVKAYYEWDWSGAEAEFKRALDLGPNSSDAHREYSRYLAAIGRYDEAIAEIRRGKELGPVSSTSALFVLAGARQYDQLIEEARKIIEIEPDQPYAYAWLGEAHLEKGMHEEAIAELEKAVSLSRHTTVMKALLGYAYAVTGRRKEAKQVLAELEGLSGQRYVSPYDIAITYAGLGDKEQTFTFLERACQERARRLWGLKVNPMWDSLRPDQRFQDLLRRVGLHQ